VMVMVMMVVIALNVEPHRAVAVVDNHHIVRGAALEQFDANVGVVSNLCEESLNIGDPALCCLVKGGGEGRLVCARVRTRVV
jgi:hypothetical protein